MDNNGDYQFRVFRPGFKKKLDSLLTILNASQAVKQMLYGGIILILAALYARAIAGE